jgi:glycosyltransferase involved in cell wall biosynthesis
MTSTKNTNANCPFVVFGDEWGLHPTSVQHLARGLANDHPLLYVNTFWQRRPHWNWNDARRAWHKLRMLTSSAPHEHGSARHLAGAHFYSPAVVPLKPFSAVRRCNRHLLTSGVRRQLRQHGLEDPALFVTLPFAAEAVGGLDERLVVYYITDQYSAMPEVYSEYIEDLEQTLLAESDLIFVTSRELLKEKNGRKSPARLLPHGVDFNHFYSAVETPARIPPELEHLPRPLLGFYGTLAPWVDAELLKHVSQAFPQASIVLIGPVWIDFPIPRDLPNVHWLGPRSYLDLPAYAKHFDVGLIPFRQNTLTAYVNPLKFLEYLALGLPVVSTPLPDLTGFADVVSIAATADEFVHQVKEALNDNAPERRLQRFAVAAGESWDARVNVIEQHVEAALRKQPGMRETQTSSDVTLKLTVPSEGLIS